MNRINRKIIISLIFIIIASTTFAVKPFRLGVKIGLPNVVSLNAEFVLPILNHRIAPTIDFSDFSLSIEDVSADFTYLEAGVNFYLAPNGKWLYANVSYINMKTNLSYTGLESDEIPGLEDGIATTEVSINTMSFKIGAKLGGLFYFRPEIGYIVTPLDSNVEITATFQGHTETQVEEIPSALTGSFIFNIGFGFAF